jgi:hypothetical protein
MQDSFARAASLSPGRCRCQEGIMNKNCLHAALVLLAGGCVAAGVAWAEVVREEGVSSIAGALGGSGPAAVEWTFKSSGGEIVFASLDADIYRAGHSGGHEVAAVSAAASGSHEAGGCSGDDEGGPGLFCLQVLDDYSQALCHAARPAPPPGWQRDPRLACVLPEARGQADYRLRVALSDGQGSCADPQVSGSHSQVHPFLLNVSRRAIAPSGVSVQTAAAQSGSRF